MRFAALGAKSAERRVRGYGGFVRLCISKAGVEAYGADIPTTRDYRALLDRKDVDAVIVAVADFQHRRVVLDCVAAGKDVYCEKPMSHNVADGLAMVQAGAERQAHLSGGQPAGEQYRYTKKLRRFTSRVDWAR